MCLISTNFTRGITGYDKKKLLTHEYITMYRNKNTYEVQQKLCTIKCKQTINAITQQYPRRCTSTIVMVFVLELFNDRCIKKYIVKICLDQ